MVFCIIYMHHFHHVMSLLFFCVLVLNIFKLIFFYILNNLAVCALQWPQMIQPYLEVCKLHRVALKRKNTQLSESWLTNAADWR